jgi:hypothetical protein
MVFSSAADSESESLPCEILEHSTSDSGKIKYLLNENLILNTRGGRSANKFRKSQIRKFVIFADLPQVWQFADLQFAEGIFK